MPEHKNHKQTYEALCDELANLFNERWLLTYLFAFAFSAPVPFVLRSYEAEISDDGHTVTFDKYDGAVSSEKPLLQGPRYSVQVQIHSSSGCNGWFGFCRLDPTAAFADSVAYTSGLTTPFVKLCNYGRPHVFCAYSYQTQSRFGFKRGLSEEEFKGPSMTAGETHVFEVILLSNNPPVFSCSYERSVRLFSSRLTPPLVV